jgi:hypothetical protein
LLLLAVVAAAKAQAVAAVREVIGVLLLVNRLVAVLLLKRH